LLYYNKVSDQSKSWCINYSEGKEYLSLVFKKENLVVDF
jgi:hypothetical protein